MNPARTYGSAGMIKSLLYRQAFCDARYPMASKRWRFNTLVKRDAEDANKNGERRSAFVL